MLQQVSKINNHIVISGEIEAVNEGGFKIKDSWYNLSRYSRNLQPLKVGDSVEIEVAHGFVDKVLKVVPGGRSPEGTAISAAAAKSDSDSNPHTPSTSAEDESDREIMRRSITDALQIAGDIGGGRFSSAEILKIGLSLFISRTSRQHADRHKKTNYREF